MIGINSQEDVHQNGDDQQHRDVCDHVVDRDQDHVELLGEAPDSAQNDADRHVDRGADNCEQQRDPRARKDVVGVALDIFIKTMSTVANTLAPLCASFHLF